MQRRALELLALEEGLGIFQQAHVVTRDDFDEMFGSGQLTQSDAEMVGVVEGVEQVFVERMNVLQTRKAAEDERELLGEGLLREFNFSGVEICPRKITD